MPEIPKMDPQAYEVIEADSAAEAQRKSRWTIGDSAQCCRLTACANSDGTFSVFPSFEKMLWRPGEDGSCNYRVSVR